MDLLAETYHESIPNYDAEFEDDLLIKMIDQFPRTFGVEEPRRHWEMLLHCERAIYPRPMPNLALPSREARFYWHLYSASAKHEPLYQRNLNLALLTTLNKLVRGKKTSRNILISQQLVRICAFDSLGRRDILNRLEKYICQQTDLETFCMEGLRLKRDEGLRLVSALKNCQRNLKSFYCWLGFDKNQGPIIRSENKICVKKFHEYLPRESEWWRAINNLKALNTISLNYSYIATPSGDLLLELAKTLGSNWQWLQLLCQENETSICDKNSNEINHSIPDIAWKATIILASSLKVQLVFVDMPEYDRHKRFFSKNTPVHTFMLSSGIDLRFRQPWYIDCTVKTLWNWYPNNLVSLYLQFWHHRENLDNLLEKIFLKLPELQTFEFIGEIKRLKTLCSMSCQIRTGRCKVKRVDVKLQEKIDDREDDRKNWKRSVECLLRCFEQDFYKMKIHFNVNYYPC